MNHRQRLEAALSGGTPDRPPVVFWRHFPVDDQTPQGLAASTLAFQNTFDFDLVKVTPASSYCLRDWGARDEWQGAADGNRIYTHKVIQRPEDWKNLPVLKPEADHLAAQLDCLRLITSQLGPETPVIQTIFSPLSQAKNLVGGANLLVHLRRFPEAVHTGLQTIAETTRLFIQAARRTGIAGIFYAVQHAQYGLLSADEFDAFGRSYDLSILEPAKTLWLNMLHIHGSDVMFDRLTDYPVQIMNWHDQETPPTLAEGLELFSGAVCGGIRREETLVFGSPEQVVFESQAAMEATGGRRFILGTGCVAPVITPYGNLMAARNALLGT